MRPSNKGTCINPIDSGFKLYTGKVVSKVKLAPPPPKPAAEKKPAAPRKRKAEGESSQPTEKKEKKDKKSAPAEAATEVAEKRPAETLTKHFQRKAPVEDDDKDESSAPKPPEPAPDSELVPLKSSKAAGKAPQSAGQADGEAARHLGCRASFLRLAPPPSKSAGFSTETARTWSSRFLRACRPRWQPEPSS